MMSKRGLTTLVTLLLCAIFALPVLAVSPNIVMSQVYGAGGNANALFKNDFVELFNRGTSPVTMTSWTIQYASSVGSTWAAATINGTIPAGGYFLVQLAGGSVGASLPTPDASASAPNLSGTTGKLALTNSTTLLSGTCPTGGSIVDFVGYGAANCSETAPVGVLSATTAALRNGNGCADTDNNSGDFTVGTPTPRNAVTPAAPCSGPTNPSGIGLATPAAGISGAATLLTVTVTPGGNPASTGITVVGDLSLIGGSATQTFYDDGSNGDVTPGDNVFSFAVFSAAGTNGVKSIAATILDAQSRSASASISYVIYDVAPIHSIQGSGDQSPMVGKVVQTSGIVTGIKSNGFFIQAPESEYDDDPNTSEAIHVFTSSAPPGVAAVGNLVSVLGTVAEYSGSDPYSPPLTELSPLTVTLLSTGNELPAPVVLRAGDFDPAGALNQLERFESMRATFDWAGGASLTVVAPTGGSLSSEANAAASSDGAFYAVLTGTARPFVEPGIETPTPLPLSLPKIPVFDGNPEKIRIASGTLIGSSTLDLASGQTLTGVVGPLDYGFRQWSIDVEPTASVSVSSALTYRAIPDKTAGEFTVATFNALRFYDDQNDHNGAVTLGNTAYLGRLSKLSLAVRNVLKLPDVIGFEEIEDKLSVLHTIAARINTDAVADGGTNPSYVAAQVPGNDSGAINVGFLIRTDRHTLTSSGQAPGSKTATFLNPTTGTYDIIFDRPPLVLRAKMAGPGGSTSDVTFIVNHLRSMSDVDNQADGRVRVKRAAGAEWLATYVNGLQTTEEVVVMGDMNAYQFNDGYVDVMGTIVGDPTPADNVQVASADLVNPNLTNHVMSLGATTERYSYTFDGNAHVFDHILSESKQAARFTRIAGARMNADFPEVLYSDFTRPEKVSDHDPMVAYFYVEALGVTPAATGSTTVCAPGTVSLLATPTGGSTIYTSYQWYRDASLIPGATSSTYEAAQSGTYTVTVTDSLGKTSAGISGVVVTVNPLPAKPTITPSGPTAFCTGGSVTLTSSSGSSYLWSTSATTSSISVSASGSYWVQATDGNGCTSPQSDPIIVTVNPLPAVTSVLPVNGSTGFTGGNVSWTATAATTYDIYFDTVNPPQKLLAQGTATTTLATPVWFSSTPYYWQIAAHGPCGDTTSAVNSFTTGTCGFTGAAPSLAAPADTASNQPIAMTLSWNALAGTAHYDVYLGTTNPPTIRHAVVSAPTTSLQVHVASGKTSYWQVKAVPVCGNSAPTTSPIWSFSTGSSTLALSSVSPLFLNRWTGGSLSILGSGFLAITTPFTDLNGHSAGTYGPGTWTATQIDGTVASDVTAPAGRYDVGVTETGTELGRLPDALVLRAFTDVNETAFFFESSSRVADAGIMEADFDAGTPGPQFGPTTIVTRASMAEYLAKSYQWIRTRTTTIPAATCTPSGGGSSDFPDVPCSHPDWLAIHWIKTWGVTAGANCVPGPGLCYLPDMSITRGQMATFLSRLKYGPEGTGTVLQGFLDGFGADDPGCASPYPACTGWIDPQLQVSPGTWPHSYVNIAYQDRLTNGCGGTLGALNFCTGQAVTRGQMAEFLGRTVGLVPTP